MITHKLGRYNNCKRIVWLWRQRRTASSAMPWPRPPLSISMNLMRARLSPMSLSAMAGLASWWWLSPSHHHHAQPFSKELRTCLILAKFELKTKSYEVPGDHNVRQQHWNARNVHRNLLHKSQSQQTNIKLFFYRFFLFIFIHIFKKSKIGIKFKNWIFFEKMLDYQK